MTFLSLSLSFQPLESWGVDNPASVDVSKWKEHFLKIFINLFLERGEGREKERERNISVWLPLTYPLLGTWPVTQACALEWESNQGPFRSQAGTQSSKPHQPGHHLEIVNKV